MTNERLEMVAVALIVAGVSLAAGLAFGWPWLAVPALVLSGVWLLIAAQVRERVLAEGVEDDGVEESEEVFADDGAVEAD